MRNRNVTGVMFSDVRSTGSLWCDGTAVSSRNSTFRTLGVNSARLPCVSWLHIISTYDAVISDAITFFKCRWNSETVPSASINNISGHEKTFCRHHYRTTCNFE